MPTNKLSPARGLRYVAVLVAGLWLAPASAALDQASGDGIALTLTASADSATPGTRVDYAVTISNQGAVTRQDVDIVLQVPAGARISLFEVMPSVSAESCSSNSACSSGEVLTWTLDRLDPGESQRITVPLSVRSDAADGISLNVGFDADFAGLGAPLGVAHELTVDEDVALTATLSGDREPVLPGEALTYTLAYGNPGAETVLDAVLTATLPTGASLVTAEGAPAVAGDTLTWDLGSVGVGRSGRFRFTVTVDGGLDAGQVLAAEAALSADFVPAARVGLATVVRSSRPIWSASILRTVARFRLARSSSALVTKGAIC